MRTRIAVVVLVLAGEGLGADQAPPQAQRAREPYSVATTAILVDTVVRDKRDNPVYDLRAEDFEIYEDGVRQEIGSFSTISRASGIGIEVKRRLPGTTTVTTGASDAAEAAPAGDEPPPTVALVFDALTPESLQLAQKAALGYVPMSGDGTARIGVFSAEPGLRVVQRYTQDAALVRQAVRRVTAAPSSREEAEVERRVALNDRLRELSTLSGGIGPGEAGGFGPGPESNSTQAQAQVEMRIAEMEMRMLRTFESLDRDHRGFGAASALVSVVQSLGLVPGRKSLVYFSEGLPASPAMQAKLDTLVNAANRANVSVYTIDAAGLRTKSTLGETRREVDMAAEERLRQTVSPRDSTDGPLMRIVERTEDLLRLDPQGGLARLAEDTGGFLVRDTNDLGSALRRIDEDNRFHYLLTYTPKNDNFDGKFRTISIKVKRDGLTVFSRKGYLAVRASSVPVLSYEAPAIAALDRRTVPNAFPISAAGLVFPSKNGRAVVPVVVQVRTADLSFEVDKEKNAYSGQAIVVARLKDAAGETLQTFSQQYVLTGSAIDLEAARQGEILFYRQPVLPAGVYRLEAIVYDAIAERASARLSTVDVPAPARQQAAASSLVLVRRTEVVPNEGRPADLPFYYGNLLLYPRAGEAYRAGADSELMFYFAFYPLPAEGDTGATIAILQSGRTLAALPLELPRAAGTERVQHVGRLPIDKFPPGTYELRLQLRTGDHEQVRTAYFTIAG